MCVALVWRVFGADTGPDVHWPRREHSAVKRQTDDAGRTVATTWTRLEAGGCTGTTARFRWAAGGAGGRNERVREKKKDKKGEKRGKTVRWRCSGARARRHTQGKSVRCAARGAVTITRVPRLTRRQQLNSVRTGGARFGPATVARASRVRFYSWTRVRGGRGGGGGGPMDPSSSVQAPPGAVAVPRLPASAHTLAPDPGPGGRRRLSTRAETTPFAPLGPLSARCCRAARVHRRKSAGPPTARPVPQGQAGAVSAAPVDSRSFDRSPTPQARWR